MVIGFHNIEDQEVQEKSTWIKNETPTKLLLKQDFLPRHFLSISLLSLLEVYWSGIQGKIDIKIKNQTWIQMKFL